MLIFSFKRFVSLVTWHQITCFDKVPTTETPINVKTESAVPYAAINLSRKYAKHQTWLLQKASIYCFIFLKQKQTVTIKTLLFSLLSGFVINDIAPGTEIQFNCQNCSSLFVATVDGQPDKIPSLQLGVQGGAS